MRFRHFLLILALAAAAGVVLYAMLIEPRRVVVEHVQVVLDDLPAELDGFRVVQLSDLEFQDNELDAHAQRVLAQANVLQADLIAITGDLIGTGSDYVKAVEGAASFTHSLRARHGVWVVRGENDFVQSMRANERFIREIPTSDVRVLINEAARINGYDLYVAGAEYQNFRPSWVTDFVIEQQQTERVLVARWSQRQSFNHYIGGDAQDWQDYEFSGRFYHTQAGGNVGVVAHSQIPRGLSRYYLLGHEGREYFVLRDSEGTRSASTGVTATPRTWYSFRLRIKNAPGFTDVRAKLWPSREVEPQTWQAIIQDDDPMRSTRGTVGLWTNGTARKLFDDLLVTALPSGLPTNAENLDGEIYLDEDFSGYMLGQNLSDWMEYGNDGEALRAAVQGLPPEATVILLMHSVDLAKQAAAEKVDLVLAGGTHGGQVRLPLLGALYTGTELGPRFSAGLFRFGGTQVYVNRGIGTSIVPLRFLAPPEITVLELRAASEAATFRQAASTGGD